LDCINIKVNHRRLTPTQLFISKMKFIIAATLSLLPALSTAHCVAQRVRVNGADNGLLTGIRVPNSNNPITNVNDGNFACNSGYRTPVSSTVINVKAGDKVGVMWGHIIGGAQSANDADNPIAKSHKGPTIQYLYVLSLHALSSSIGVLKCSGDSQANPHPAPRSTTQPQPNPPVSNGSRSLKTVSMVQANGVSIV
jgi:hypothetical protein